MNSAADITGIILAGGRGQRMGGRDKGLLSLGGRPLVARLAEALAPQVAELLIVANRNPHLYGRYARVVRDRRLGYQGPLAGVEAGLAAVTTPLALVVPCDVPGLPADLAARLRAALLEQQAELALIDDGRRRHPLPCLLRADRLGLVSARLDAGVRSLHEGLAGLRQAVLGLPGTQDCLASMNTPEELARREAGCSKQQQADRL